MGKKLAPIIMITVIFFFPRFIKADPLFDPSPSPSPLAAATPAPFWKTKTGLYKKMKEDRYIVVSAHEDNDGASAKKLTIITAGIIHAPVSFVDKGIMAFKEYPSYLPYIEETSYDAVTGNLFVHGSLLGYHVRMTLHIVDKETIDGHQINWESISGAFVGMKGTIDEKSLDGDHTETSMNAAFSGPSIPIPSFILKWGLEYAGQKVTAVMRTHIESDWETAKKH